MGRLRRLIPRYSLRTLSVFLLLVTSGMGLTTCIDLRMYPEGRQYSERVALGMHLHQKGRDAWPPDEASEGASFEAYCRIHRAVVHALELRAFLRDKRATSSRWYRDNRQSIESVLRMAQDGPRRLERRRAGVVAALPEGEKAQVLDMDREIADALRGR